MSLFERAEKIKLRFPTRQKWEDSSLGNRFRLLLEKDYFVNNDTLIIDLCKYLIEKYFVGYCNSPIFIIIDFDLDASYDEAIKLMDLLLRYTKYWIFS